MDSAAEERIAAGLRGADGGNHHARRASVPLVLGGVSFGGMLAYEMARHLKPDAVVLIASCRTPAVFVRSIAPGVGCCRWIPVWAWSVAKLLSGPVVRIRPACRRASATWRSACSRRRIPASCTGRCRRSSNWDPQPLAGVRVFQIHGRRDPLIPARRVEADVLIPDGGHMINVTHAREVNAFIRGAVAAVT